MKELNKTYDPCIVEDRIYADWLENNYFHAEVDETKEPYTIVIPPPNITGQLHMGHALDNTIQDILIRTKRMQGYNALWMPGTDHASISTEVKIVEKMAEEGLTKKDIGREAFLERAWAWKDEYGNRILQQLKKLGCSCDWERERFTLDEGLSAAVLEVFVRQYNKGHIYRGEKLVNWCPHCKTTISDAEVNHEDLQGNFWHFKYQITGTDEYIAFATTRPETMLGDTAVAVNPDDERYAKFVGKTVTVPIVNREIPIIADEYVEKDFGTGVVKITPAHDPNDFMVGERHNLPRINIMNDDGSMNENAGSYQGLDRYEARKRIIEEFKTLGLFIKQEPITHAVGLHERCNQVVEPLMKLQWFMKMKPLAGPAIDVYKDGRLRIVPDRFGKVYLHWLENIKDWCISRQLWWGHRIPAYYCDECGHVHVATTKPEKCEKCTHTGLTQDEDTLDTWFSSALWPFSTLGWPNETKELKHFYPTNVLVTAYDILFFWVVRMVFSGMEHMGEVPFKDVLFHGLIRDSQGRKMSKSLGNGIDPLEVVEKFGADALRLTLVSGTSLGNDLRFYYEKLEANRNFLNKIWNATRFILMNISDEDEKALEDENFKPSFTVPDRWILSKINTLAKEVCENIDHYELSVAVNKIHEFIWDEYCDWYIEMVKPRLYNKEDPTRLTALWTLKQVLIDSMKLLHPFMPFITEEIFTSVQSKEKTVMLSSYPAFKDENCYPEAEKAVGLVKEAVKGIRNIRVQMNVPPSKKVNITVVSAKDEVLTLFKDSAVFFAPLANAKSVDFAANNSNIPEDSVSVVIQDCVLYMPFAELVDVSAEIERLTKEKNRLNDEVSRIEKKLSNEGFMAKAPAAVVDVEREKMQKYSNMLEQVIQQLEGLKKY